MLIESRFWDWFQVHEDELFNFQLNQEDIFQKLSLELEKVNDDLTFELGPVQDGVREFVITAAGIKESFPAVESLYNSKPTLSKFYVTAFRPRRSVINNIEYGDLSIKSSDVYFRLCKDDDPQKIGVLLFLPEYSDAQEADFGQIGFLFLDEALGEYDMETKVGFIQQMGHESKYFKGAHPIKELANGFDSLLQSKAST